MPFWGMPPAVQAGMTLGWPVPAGPSYLIRKNPRKNPSRCPTVPGLEASCQTRPSRQAIFRALSPQPTVLDHQSTGPVRLQLLCMQGRAVLEAAGSPCGVPASHQSCRQGHCCHSSWPTLNPKQAGRGLRLQSPRYHITGAVHPSATPPHLLCQLRQAWVHARGCGLSIQVAQTRASSLHPGPSSPALPPAS